MSKNKRKFQKFDLSKYKEKQFQKNSAVNMKDNALLNEIIALFNKEKLNGFLNNSIGHSDNEGIQITNILDKWDEYLGTVAKVELEKILSNLSIEKQEKEVVKLDEQTTEIEEEFQIVPKNDFYQDSDIIQIKASFEDDESLKILDLIAKRWLHLTKLLEESSDDKIEFIKRINDYLRTILDDIKGVKLPIRKFILVWIAQKVNEKIDDFEFISPEKYSKIEPTYHNIIGEKGTRVSEGVSFIIVRKHSKSVFLKADVKAF